MGSLMHPWGHVYSVGGHYSSYGPSPFAWIIDVVVLLILIGIVIAIIKASTTRNVIYRKRF